MKFGIFLPPFHPPGQDPALAYQGDLELKNLGSIPYSKQWTAEPRSKLMERGGIGVALATQEYLQASAVKASTTKDGRSGIAESELTLK